jgi:hypothetical protein
MFYSIYSVFSPIYFLAVVERVRVDEPVASGVTGRRSKPTTPFGACL